MSSPIRPGQVHRLSSPRPLPQTHDVNENKSSPLRSTPSLLASTFQPPRSSPLASTSSSTSTSRPPPPSRSFSAPPRPPPPPPPEEVIDVAVERYSSSRRLLDEWEQIALKYKDVKLEDDDEIDIRTGKIVKDRGRLRAMEKVRFFGDDRSEDEGEEEGLVEEDEDDDGLGGWDLKQFESFDQEEEEEPEEGGVEEEEPQEPPPPKSYLYFPPPPPPLVIKKHVVDEGDLKEFLEESRRRKELGLDGDVEEESATGSTGSDSGGGWDDEEEGSYDEGEETGGLEEEDADDEERRALQNQLTTLNAFDLSDDDPLASSPIPQEKFHRSASLPATASTFQRPTPPPTISYPLSSSTRPSSFLSRSSPISKSPLKNGSSSTRFSPPRVPPPPIDISDSSDDDEEEDEEEEDEEDDAFVPPEEEEQEQAAPMEVDSESDSETEPIENDDDNDGDDLNILPSPFKPKSEPVSRSVPPSHSRPSPPSPPSSASPPPSFALATVEEEDSDSSRTRRRSSRTPVPRDFFSSAGYLPAPLHLSSLPSSTRPQQRPPLPKPFSHIPFSRPPSLGNINAQQPRFASALPTPPLSSTSSSSSSIFNPTSSSSSSSLINDLPTTSTITAGSSNSIRQVRFASPEEEGDMSPIRPSRKPMHRVTAREALKPLIARIWADELKGRELLDEAKKAKEEEGKKRKRNGEELGGMGKKSGKGKERATVVGGGFGFFDRPKSWEEDEEEAVGESVEDDWEEEEEEKPVVAKETVWEDGVEVLMVAPWPGTVEKRTREEKKTESKMIVKRRRILSPETVERMEEEQQEREDPHRSTTTATSRSQRRSSLPNFRPSISSSTNLRIASPAQRPIASKSIIQPKLERPSPAPSSRLDQSSSLLGDSNPSRTPRPSSSLREDVKPTLDSSWKEIEEVFGPAGTKSAKAEKTFLDTPTLMGTIERTVALLQLRRGTEKWGEEVVREANEEWKGASSSSSTQPSFLRTDPLSLSLDDDSNSLLPSCSNCLIRDRPSHLADVCLGRLLLPVGTQPDPTTSSTAPRRTFCSYLDGADRRPWEKVVTSRWKTKEEEVDGELVAGGSTEEPWSLDRFIDSLPDEDASPSTSTQPQRKRSSSARPRYTL